VGKQYLDNTSNDYRSLNPYFVSNFEAGYSWKGKLFKEVLVGIQVNNIFNELYENNGYTYSYFYGGQTTTENFYYPQAGLNFMSRLVVKM
jgi:iron complex outermembrane receptor protein